MATVTGSSVVEVDGKGLFVKVEGNNVVTNAPVTVAVVANTSTDKVSTQTIVPKAEAVATVITGLSKDVDSAIREGGKLTISNTDLVVEDQYGQIITDEKVLETLGFEVTAANALTFTATADAANKSVEIAPVKDAAKTSDRLTFKLLDADS